MVCLGRPHHFRFFKGSPPQILIGPFLNTLTHILWHHHSPDRTSQIYSRLLVLKWGEEESYSVANNCNTFFGFIYLLINVMFKGMFLIKIYPQVLFMDICWIIKLLNGIEWMMHFICRTWKNYFFVLIWRM